MIENVPEGTSYNIDWDAFRAESAKDLLPLATQMKDYRGFPEECVSLAIQVADELIKQLKERE